jgi:hypothetical protein
MLNVAKQTVYTCLCTNQALDFPSLTSGYGSRHAAHLEPSKFGGMHEKRGLSNAVFILASPRLEHFKYHKPSANMLQTHQISFDLKLIHK